jgi:hypothetical protein
MSVFNPGGYLEEKNETEMHGLILGWTNKKSPHPLHEKGSGDESLHTSSSIVVKRS